jgi:SAM-dependent methyltransferase
MTDQTATVAAQEQAFLEWLNARLPEGVDWQQGALDYVAARLNEEHGEFTRRFHLTKPFYCVGGDKPINQQLMEFSREVAFFVNVLSMLAVSPESRFLDVACGSGWWTHFLAKLGLSVVGIDISPDMIALTQERLRLDGIPTQYADRFDHITLQVHDMEQAPLPQALHCQVAVLESALHHFVNPIQTLRNIADSLTDDGIIVILELSSDGQGDQVYTNVMECYDTLERPYTRDQMVAILNFSGVAEYQFFHPVNGFFAQSGPVADRLRHDVAHDPTWNIVFAAKRPGVLTQYLQSFAGGIAPITGQVPQQKTDAETVAAAATIPVVRTENYPVAELGIQGEWQILTATAQRLMKKSIGKLGRTLQR